MIFPSRNDWLRYLGRATGVNNYSGKRFKHESAVITLEECVGDAVIVPFPHSPGVKLFLKHMPASLTFSISLVECFELLTFWGKLVGITLNKLCVDLRVEFFKVGHIEWQL